jgi:hypothetical protein
MKPNTRINNRTVESNPKFFWDNLNTFWDKIGVYWDTGIVIDWIIQPSRLSFLTATSRLNSKAIEWNPKFFWDYYQLYWDKSGVYWDLGISVENTVQNSNIKSVLNNSGIRNIKQNIWQEQ